MFNYILGNLTVGLHWELGESTTNEGKYRICLHASEQDYALL
jgi:hypothetical protein